MFLHEKSYFNSLHFFLSAFFSPQQTINLSFNAAPINITMQLKFPNSNENNNNNLTLKMKNKYKQKFKIKKKIKTTTKLWNYLFMYTKPSCYNFCEKCIIENSKEKSNKINFMMKIFIQIKCVYFLEFVNNNKKKTMSTSPSLLTVFTNRDKCLTDSNHLKSIEKMWVRREFFVLLRFDL